LYKLHLLPGTRRNDRPAFFSADFCGRPRQPPRILSRWSGLLDTGNYWDWPIEWHAHGTMRRYV